MLIILIIPIKETKIVVNTVNNKICKASVKFWTWQSLGFHLHKTSNSLNLLTQERLQLPFILELVKKAVVPRKPSSWFTSQVPPTICAHRSTFNPISLFPVTNSNPDIFQNRTFPATFKGWYKICQLQRKRSGVELQLVPEYPLGTLTMFIFHNKFNLIDTRQS